MNRRAFLSAAATAGVVGVAGCNYLDGTPDQSARPTGEAPTQTPEGTPIQDPEQTPTLTSSQRIIDTGRMKKVAADVSPGDEVSMLVNDIESGELLVFPPGKFKWAGQATVVADNWGIMCHKDTVFEVPAGIGDGEEHELLSTFSRERASDYFLLENLTFDSPGRAAPAIHLGVEKLAHVAGLHYKMNGPLSDQWQENGLRAFVTEADGVLWVDDYTQFNNGDLGGYGGGDSRIGIWVGPRNDGTVHLSNPILQGFPNNACYVSRQPGTVIIEGGLLMDNNVSAVRVSGGVVVRGTTIYLDVDRYLEGPGVLEADAHNTRGVWGDNHGPGTNGGLVTDTTFILRSYRKSYGLATILRNRKMTIRNCHFILDSDIVGVVADNGEIVVENSAFGGQSLGSVAGTGNITGSGNSVARNIAPGDIPFTRRCENGSLAGVEPMPNHPFVSGWQDACSPRYPWNLLD
jgi:hypothetical protein